MEYVYKICGGNIHYTENQPIELSKDKLKRYMERLNDMNVLYGVVDNSIVLL